MKKFLKALVSSTALGELEQEMTQKRAHEAAKKIQTKLHDERSSEIISALEKNRGLTEEGFKNFLIQFIESNGNYISKTLKIGELNQEVNFESRRIFEKINELYKTYSINVYPVDGYAKLLDYIHDASNILLSETSGPQTISAKIIRNRVKIAVIESRISRAKMNKNFLELNSLTSELNALTTNKLLLMREADTLASELPRPSVEITKPRLNENDTEGLQKNPARNNLPGSTHFPRDRMDLADDGYKLYLADKYKIIRNELFQKYVCEQKFYDSIEEILRLLDERERIAQQSEQVDLLSAINTPVPSEKPPLEIRQQTYKGRVITLVDGQYKVNDIIQRFESLAQAMMYIDTLKIERPAVRKKNSSMPSWLSFSLTVSAPIIFVLLYSNIFPNGTASSTKPDKPLPTASSRQSADKRSGVTNQSIEVNKVSCQSISNATKYLVSGIARELQADPSEIEFGKAVWIEGRGCYVEVFFQNVEFNCQVGEIYKVVEANKPVTIHALGTFRAPDDKSGTTCIR